MVEQRTKKSRLVLRGVVYLWMIVGILTVGTVSDVKGQESSSIPGPQNLPRLELGEAVYNFGEVSEGDVVSHDFVVKNTGKGELKIHKVSPD